MTTSLDRPTYDRPYIDYDHCRTVAGQIRAEMMTDAASRGLAVVTPSRRTLRNLGLAFLLAAGAFWTVMLNDPPKTVAADPNASAKAVSPLDLPMPLGLPAADHADH
jgi:hypothetical protein